VLEGERGEEPVKGEKEDNQKEDKQKRRGR